MCVCCGDVQVKRETQQLREFEEGLVSQYKFFLENLEQTVKGRHTHRYTHTHTSNTSKPKESDILF